MNRIVVDPVLAVRPVQPVLRRDLRHLPDAERHRPRPQHERTTPLAQRPPELLPAETVDDLTPPTTIGNNVDTFALPHPRQGTYTCMFITSL